MARSTLLRLIAGLVVACLATPALAANEDTSNWNFRVTLDGTPVGTHSFVVSGPREARRVSSRAEFTVRLLGLVVYRYRHEASESWKGDCLDTLSSSTNDDGKRRQVQVTSRGDGSLVINGAEPTPDASGGCTMSFAYWNPGIQAQSRLLNPQSGRIESVRMTREEDGSIDVQGRPTPAARWRIHGPEHPIDVWYADQGRWVGLDSTLAKGRVLRYRLP